MNVEAYMLTQRAELAKRLPQHGWRVHTVEDSALDWWADEIWTVESVWSQSGFRLYLTFLTDPMASIHRAKGRNVWALGTSVTRPVDRHSAEGQPLLSLGQGWRTRLAGYLAAVSELRDRSARGAC